MKLIADTHIHSCASSHAYSTVSENIRAAREAGMLYMAMTEHGPTMPDAPHIWHIVNQREIPEFYDGVHILHGVEANVMDSKGTIDIKNDVLSTLDWVIVSMHVPCFPPSTVANHTEAWINIAKNPNVDVIGHCGDIRYAFDYEKVIRIFKEYGKIVEINNNSFHVRPGTKGSCVDIARMCKKLEVPVVVNTDSHFSSRIGHFDVAIKMLTELDFPEKLIINADAERFAEIAAYKKGENIE